MRIILAFSLLSLSLFAGCASAPIVVCNSAENFEDAAEDLNVGLVQREVGIHKSQRVDGKKDGVKLDSVVSISQPALDSSGTLKTICVTVKFSD